MSQVAASHILVEDQTTAQSLLQKLTESSTMETFVELAKQHSKCPSGQNGGNLGMFGPGQMVKPFEDAVLSMTVGQVSNPVQTQFGWHIIVRLQ
jgi:peptidyl-prolyl cis-trans isomerase C